MSCSSNRHAGTSCLRAQRSGALPGDINQLTPVTSLTALICPTPAPTACCPLPCSWELGTEQAVLWYTMWVLWCLGSKQPQMGCDWWQVPRLGPQVDLKELMGLSLGYGGRLNLCLGGIRVGQARGSWWYSSGVGGLKEPGKGYMLWLWNQRGVLRSSLRNEPAWLLLLVFSEFSSNAEPSCAVEVQQSRCAGPPVLPFPLP